MQKQTHNSDNIIQRGINWISKNTFHRLSNFLNTDHERQSPYLQKILMYPYLAQNTQEARNYALQRVRDTLKNRNKPQKQEQVIDRLRRSSLYWGTKITDEKKPHELMCPICMDFLVGGVTTPCGHSFCWQCLDEAVLLNPNCPVCRTNIRGKDFIQSLQLSAVINRFIKRYQPINSHHSELLYQARQQKFDQWLNNRNINPKILRPSDLLDVRDPEYVWCNCIVQEVLVVEGNVSLLVHYIGWSNIYNQVIQISSQRLASYKFYTRRTDIPHYVLNQNEINQLQGYVSPEEVANRSQEDYDSYQSRGSGSIDNITLELLNEQESDQNIDSQISPTENDYNLQFTKQNTKIETNLDKEGKQQ